MAETETAESIGKANGYRRWIAIKNFIVGVTVV